MSSLKKILDVIHQAREQEHSLNLEDTLTLFDAVKHISQDRALIEKAIYLIFLIKKQEPNLDRLTHRENEVFRLVGLGFTSREIADLLSISEATVSTHRKKIIKKLKLAGAGQLQKLAYQYTNSQLSNKYTL
ncbi:MAG: LuxR C-terminal-related transcriptional regulator [Bacteroidetes bacterium]|nr:LuxR C-terminal-related transcriptional regulator [Bacteroidota bacterium]